jgi:hypothetical protein
MTDQIVIEAGWKLAEISTALAGGSLASCGYKHRCSSTMKTGTENSLVALRLNP